MRETARAHRSDRGSFILDRQGTILGFDQGLETLTGWPAVEVVGRNKDLGSSPDGEPDEDGQLPSPPLYSGEILMDPSPRNFNLMLFGRDGRRMEIEALARKLPGLGERIQVTVLRVLGRSADSLEQRLFTEFDTLTGLANRSTFEARLTEDFRDAAAAAQPLALILADIDHLRELNTHLGREAGDEVLLKLAGILRVAVEDETRIYRLADDDFAILLPGAGRGDARQIAAGLRSTVERYRFFPQAGRVDLPVTLSLGASSFPADAERQAQLYERALEALNDARSMGRNRVWCYLRRPRVPLRVPVFFDGADALLVGYTRDLSPSGIFVQTAAPIDIGMRCALSFPLPGHDGRVQVIGRVVRTVPSETAAEIQEVRIPGMGVEFERFSGFGDRRAIEAFLHCNESTTLRPESGTLSVG